MTNYEQPIPPQTGGGTEPSSPADLGPVGWKESLRRAVKEFKADRGSMTSAGMAYYWFLAVFPALLAAVGVLGMLRLSAAGTRSIVAAIERVLPGDAASVLTDAVRDAGSRSSGGSLVAALIGVLLAFWGASAGMVAMQTGLDVAYDVPEERKFVKQRLYALLLVLLTAVLGGVATALIVFGAPLGEALEDRLPFGGAFAVVWTVGRWLLGIGALTVLFATFYYVAPNRESPRWVWLSPGGLLAVLIWLVASLGFSFYVSSFGSYAETYGSLAGVVVLLLWLYLTALAIVAGGELNAELERQAAMAGGGGKAGGGKAKRARRGAADAPRPEAANGHREVDPEWRERMRRLNQWSEEARSGG